MGNDRRDRNERGGGEQMSARCHPHDLRGQEMTIVRWKMNMMWWGCEEEEEEEGKDGGRRDSHGQDTERGTYKHFYKVSKGVQNLEWWKKKTHRRCAVCFAIPAWTTTAESIPTPLYTDTISEWKETRHIGLKSQGHSAAEFALRPTSHFHGNSFHLDQLHLHWRLIDWLLHMIYGGTSTVKLSNFGMILKKKNPQNVNHARSAILVRLQVCAYQGSTCVMVSKCCPSAPKWKLLLHRKWSGCSYDGNG